MPLADESTAEPTLPPTLAILPLRDRVLLPSSAMKLELTNPRSVALVDGILSSGTPPGALHIGVVPLRRDAADAPPSSASGVELADFPDPDDVVDVRERLHDIGVAARIIQVVRTSGPKRGYTLLLEGRCRFEVAHLVAVSPALVAAVHQLDGLAHPGALGHSNHEASDPSSPRWRPRSNPTPASSWISSSVARARASSQVAACESAPAHRLADLFVAAFEDGFDQRLDLLSITCPKERMRRASALIETHLGALTVNADVAKRVEGRLSKTQREYILRQQMQAIKEELGEGQDGENGEDDLEALHRRLLASAPPPSTLRQAESELRKLRKMTEQAPAYGSSRAWLECVASLPWSKEAGSDAPEVGIAEARRVLDAEHYGLDKVKDQIVEYLAVRSLTGGATAHLVLLARSSAGKTTLARSIAETLSRPFQRISLGGVRDEADVRGHRRTYIASMPGRLINGVKRVGVKDPVMLLDEIDKMGGFGLSAAVRGARPGTESPIHRSLPRRAVRSLPGHVPRHRQRRADHPGPLRDRMEMIDVPGYTKEEKHKIAARHIGRESSKNTASRDRNRNFESRSRPSRRSCEGTRAKRGSEVCSDV